MKNKTLILFFIVALLLFGTVVNANNSYVVESEDFSSQSLGAEKWFFTTTNESIGEILLGEEPENESNRCLMVNLKKQAESMTYSQAFINKSYGSSFTTSFRMKLYTGDNGRETEYAGFYIQYKNDNEFLALEWSRRLGGTKVALVKDGYDSWNTVIADVPTNLQYDWNPYEWTNYKIVCNGNKIMVFVNDNENPCITYEENNYMSGKMGFFNKAMYAENSRLYVDDLIIKNEASAISEVYSITGEEKIKLANESQINSRFVDSVKIGFSELMKEANLRFLDNENNEIDFISEYSSEDNVLVLSPKSKLGNWKMYSIVFDSLVTADDEKLLSVPPIKFISARNAVDFFVTLNGQNLSIQVERLKKVSNVIIYAAHYKNNALVELIPVVMPSVGNPGNVVLAKTVDDTSKIELFSFFGDGFEKNVSEPIVCK